MESLNVITTGALILLLALLAIILLDVGAQIRLGAWLIARGRALHRKRQAAAQIDREAMEFARGLADREGVERLEDLRIAPPAAVEPEVVLDVTRILDDERRRQEMIRQRGKDQGPGR